MINRGAFLNSDQTRESDAPRSFLCPEGFDPDKWARMPPVAQERILSIRSGRALEELRAQNPKQGRKPGVYNPPFSTDYAIKWGERQGWKLLDRERYNHKIKRTTDLQLGMDAMFESENGLVLIQGAGRYERAAHYERFMQWGGPLAAKRRYLTIYYVEFERGNTDPLLVECWVEGPALQTLLPV